MPQTVTDRNGMLTRTDRNFSCRKEKRKHIFLFFSTDALDFMATKPRLYARTRAKKTDTSFSSSHKPDVLVLLDNEIDSKVIINLLKKEPILCQVIELLSIDCLDQYYQSHDDNNPLVYLVRSASFAKSIHELSKTRDDFYTITTALYTLYSYEDSPNYDEDCSNFNEAERLAKALRNHLSSLLTLEDVELSSQSVSAQAPQFAWFQFMFILLSHLERSDIDMKELINVLHAYEYISESKAFKEFVATYAADQAIEWCMKDSFYFGHINRILRSKNLNDIFAHRVIIHDIEQNLISLHYDQQHIWDAFLPMNVYRGQKTSRQELQSWQSNIGSIITMNSFLSTSMEKKIANVFTETFDNDDNDDEATLFKIRIDKNTAPKAKFVYLYHADCDIDDCEILFSLRTLFRIEKVKHSKWDETWYVDMTVVDQDNNKVQRAIDPWKTSILDNSNFLQSKNEQLIYVRDLSADNGAFLAFQLSLDIVLRLDRNDFSRQEMLSICRAKFYHDRFKLAKIDRFEKMYQSEQDAVKWYTADSFLYRLLNDVLRAETVDSIFKLRYFIQDLHNQLALLQIDYLKRLQADDTSILTLYRGQVMTWYDLEHIFRVNKGSLISMNSFLSTTTDRYAARIFSGDGFIEDSEKYVSVLFEISIDIRLSHSVPFAELGDLSHFEDESEVLFSMGAVFRIEDTFEENKYLWTVKLTLTAVEDEQWNILTQHLQQREEASIVISRQTSIIDSENDESIIRTVVQTRRKRSHSFDEYRYSKRTFYRSNRPCSLSTRMSRRFEHPAFQTIYKEI
jgi:hypothetical protein